MKIGRSFISNGQHYECVDCFGYQRPAAWVSIYTLRSMCPDCGKTFECTATKTQRKNNSMPRRCERCRAPGRPVVMPAERPERKPSALRPVVMPERPERKRDYASALALVD